MNRRLYEPHFAVFPRSWSLIPFGQVAESQELYDAYHDWRRMYRADGDVDSFKSLCEYGLKNNRTERAAVNIMARRNITQCDNPPVNVRSKP